MVATLISLLAKNYTSAAEGTNLHGSRQVTKSASSAAMDQCAVESYVQSSRAVALAQGL